MKTTLFECLCQALGSDSPKDIHKRLLTRFVRDVFHVDGIQELLLLEIESLCVHDRALVDMLDGKHHRAKDARHFVYYHRKDLTRCSSLSVFTELVWREFGLRVHICTLLEREYYFDDLTIEHTNKGDFRLCDAPLLLVPMKPLFMLRRSQDGVNLPVDVLQRVGSHCHVLEFKPRHIDCLYQIYTADDRKTYYALPKNNLLQVFCAVGAVIKLLGETRDADNYVCFSLTEDVTAIIVCVAPSEADIKNAIADETKFSLE